jgi:hypothetical protein
MLTLDTFPHSVQPSSIVKDESRAQCIAWNEHAALKSHLSFVRAFRFDTDTVGEKVEQPQQYF